MNGKELLEALLAAQAEGRDLNDLAIIITLEGIPATGVELDPTENTLLIF